MLEAEPLLGVATASTRAAAQANGPVVVAWEQGLNLGHLIRQREVLHMLRTQGLSTLWAVSEGRAGHYSDALKGADCTKVIVRTPPRSAGFSPPQKLTSFVDVLACQGWTDSAWLGKAVRPWLTLFRSARPRLVMLDYAPVAQLAAYFLRIPTLHVSSGFDAPPAHCPAFAAPTSPSDGIGAPEIRAKASLELCVNEAAAANHVAGAEHTLAEILSYPQTLLDCLPQTDPYGPREGTYAPFFPDVSHGEKADWPAPPAGSPPHKAFVYLRNITIAAAVLHLLGGRGVATLCVWPDYKKGEHPVFADHISVHANAINLTAVLREASVIVSYGSAGLTALGVAAGVPQLIVPTDVEKQMIGRRIASQGLGLMLESRINNETLGEGLDLLLNTSVYRENCRRVQALYAEGDGQHDFAATLEKGMRTLGVVMQGAPKTPPSRARENHE